MFKRFLNGLVFGFGFAIAWIIAFTLYTSYFLEYQLKTMGSGEVLASLGRPENVVNEVPELKSKGGYLGSTGHYAERYPARADVLVAGPGTIRGMVTRDGMQAPGTKLRLALNGSVMSQWSVAGPDGQYAIQVPYGKYRISGYELDDQVADTALDGLIEDPNNSNRSPDFEVTSDSAGAGLDLNFVRPIVKSGRHAIYDLSEDPKISWEEYPGAKHYSVQIQEKKTPGDYRGEHVFDWSELPESENTSFSLAPYKDLLKPGRYYSFDVTAKGEDHATLSHSARNYDDYDFQVK